MYNNFLVQKKNKQNANKTFAQKKMKTWLHKYQVKIQPHLLDKYNQRINSFITKIQQSPLQLAKYQANDIKKAKEEYLKEQISELSRKGGKIFKFRDAADFNSYFNQAQRIQRIQNKLLFQKKYGDPLMAYRSIASQSDYNPSLLNQFRQRDKYKEINPPMRYSKKFQKQSKLMQRKSKSVFQKSRKNLHLNSQKSKGKYQQKQHDIMIRRRSTSYAASLVGTQDDVKSVNSIKQGSQSSQQSHKNLKRFSVTLQNPREKSKQSSKSYFIGITDIKQNCKDPHVKKNLHNILVKIGKTHPNPRDRSLISNIQVLSAEIN